MDTGPTYAFAACQTSFNDQGVLYSLMLLFGFVVLQFLLGVHIINRSSRPFPTYTIRYSPVHHSRGMRILLAPSFSEETPSLWGPRL